MTDLTPFLALAALLLAVRAWQEWRQPGLWRASGVVGKAPPCHDPQAGDTHLATIYLRAGRPVLRRTGR
jgi:hypothetical protein